MKCDHFIILPHILQSSSGVRRQGLARLIHLTAQRKLSGPAVQPAAESGVNHAYKKSLKPLNLDRLFNSLIIDAGISGFRKNAVIAQFGDRSIYLGHPAYLQHY
jgi:hypothetical protein